MKRIYISGPMTGYPDWNFPAFDKVRDTLKATGYDPVSPADIDRACGPDTFPDGAGIKRIVQRDIEALMTCDAIVLMAGWERSKGAQAELAVAKWLQLDVWGKIVQLSDRTIVCEPLSTEPAITPPIPPAPDILDEAKAITSNERKDAYGPPTEDFARIAAMWTELFGIEVQPHQVGLAMIALKLSRAVQSPTKRDHWVDIVGYARCGFQCVEAK